MARWHRPTSCTGKTRDGSFAEGRRESRWVTCSGLVFKIDTSSKKWKERRRRRQGQAQNLTEQHVGGTYLARLRSEGARRLLSNFSRIKCRYSCILVKVVAMSSSHVMCLKLSNRNEDWGKLTDGGLTAAASHYPMR